MDFIGIYLELITFGAFSPPVSFAYPRQRGLFSLTAFFLFVFAVEQGAGKSRYAAGCCNDQQINGRKNDPGDAVKQESCAEKIQVTV